MKHDVDTSQTGGEVGRELPAHLAPWVTEQVNGITRLKLETPLTFGSETSTELSVRPVTAKQLRMMGDDTPEADQFLVMAEELCGLTRNQVDTIAIADALRLIEVIGRGFGDGPGTGDG